MKKYKMEILEVRAVTVEVEANDDKEAHQTAIDFYTNGDDLQDKILKDEAVIANGTRIVTKDGKQSDTPVVYVDVKKDFYSEPCPYCDGETHYDDFQVHDGYIFCADCHKPILACDWCYSVHGQDRPCLRGACPYQKGI